MFFHLGSLSFSSHFGCFVVFSTLVVKLINEIASNCNQQPGLSITGWGRVTLVGGAIASPQADATWRGVLCLRKMASAVWGMTQHRDPGGCSFSSCPRATNPRLFRSVSALPLLEPRVRDCKWNFLCWPIKRLSVFPVVSPWQRENLLLFTDGCYWVPYWLWCCRLGSPAWGSDPALLRGSPPGTEISLWNFSCHLWGPSQPSHTAFTLPTSLVLVKCFLLSVLGYNAFLQLVFSWLFRMILYNLVVIPN